MHVSNLPSYNIIFFLKGENVLYIIKFDYINILYFCIVSYERGLNERVLFVKKRPRPCTTETEDGEERDGARCHNF
jgi:hypothetical protein